MPRSGKKVRAKLNKKTYAPGQRMRLRIVEDLKPGRKIKVTDSGGLRWTRVKKSGRRQVWTATAGLSGAGTVTVVAKWPDGRVVHNRRYRDRVRYKVGRRGAGSALVGMSAPAALWTQRLREVGPGVGARRIFADLADGAGSQLKLVEQAHAAGMLPVVSYKVGGDLAGAIGGRYDAVAEQAATELASFGLPTAVTFWHEPYGDMSGAQYAAASRQLLPIFKRGELRVGPLLNGWLLDNQQDVFESFCPGDLFAIWDWFGIDTYESGAANAPGPRKPADRVPALVAYMKSRGYDLPIGIGEYNGYSAASIAAVGQALLSTPEVWFGCLWNSVGDKGFELSGDRLAAFQQTLSQSVSLR